MVAGTAPKIDQGAAMGGLLSLAVPPGARASEASLLFQAVSAMNGCDDVGEQSAAL
jgi:hypothetical protein